MSLTEKIFVLAVGLLIIIFIAVSNLNKSDKLKQLKEKYEAALQGADRQEAWDAGRAYYRFLRGSDLTIEDEQTIMREMAHMPPEENKYNTEG
jgi:hypothetical protein